MPDLFDRIELEPEGLGQGLLREARVDPDSKLAERQLQKREPARCIEMIEHARERVRRVQLARRPQAVDRIADSDGRVVDLRRLGLELGPQQRDRFRRVADIVAAHVEEDGIDPLLDQAADGGRLNVRNLERPGQRREPVAAVGVGGFPEVIADQPELGVARARIDEVVEQLREGAHRASNARVAKQCLVKAHGERGENRVAVALRTTVECFVDMLEAGAERDSVAGQERELSRVARQLLEHGEPVDGRELADRVHARIKVERGKAWGGFADFGDARSDLRPHMRERIGRHGLASC